MIGKSSSSRTSSVATERGVLARVNDVQLSCLVPWIQLGPVTADCSGADEHGEAGAGVHAELASGLNRRARAERAGSRAGEDGVDGDRVVHRRHARLAPCEAQVRRLT
jgi:hypothetical protein